MTFSSIVVVGHGGAPLPLQTTTALAGEGVDEREEAANAAPP
jgi:hypothetical protein